MNYYLIVEGRVVEKEVYKEWVPLVNNNLKYVTHVSELKHDTFTIVSGCGYPYYFTMLEAAVEDIKGMLEPTCLVVCVDAEDMSRLEKYNEINDYIIDIGGDAINYKIVVQYFCFEVWALGNRKLSTPSNNMRLSELRNHYNVAKKNPEDMPPILNDGLNRSQLAEKYLRLLLNNKNKNLTYSKSAPGIVKHHKYFQQVKARFDDTGHIESFSTFLRAFV